MRWGQALFLGACLLVGAPLAVYGAGVLVQLQLGDGSCAVQASCPLPVTTVSGGGSATLSNYSANVTTAGSGAGTGGVAIGSAGVRKLYSYQIYNGNATVCYIQFFDQTQALTNLGTTVPVKSVGIPANGGANLSSSIPLVTTATALTIGVTTTRNGSTACGTGLDINLDYN